MVIQNPYYDPVVLGDYLSKTRGQGLTPEFTNIPGAPGFQIGNGIQSPAEEELGDEASILGLPEIESYTDKYEAEQVHLNLSQALGDELFNRRQKIEEAQGIPKLLREIDYYKATGLGTTPLVAQKEEELITAYQESDRKLVVSKDGIGGLEAKNYRDRKRYLQQLAQRADQLAKPKEPLEEGELTDAEKVAVQVGLGLQGIPVLAELQGVEPEEVTVRDIAGLNKDKLIFIQNEIESGGDTNLGNVVNSIPGSMDLLKKKLARQLPQTEMSMITNDLDKLVIDANKAKEHASTLRDEEGKPLSIKVQEAKGLLSGEKRKSLIKEAQALAVNRVLVKYENEFRDARFTLDTVDLGNIMGTTVEEQEIIATIQPELQEYLTLSSDPDIKQSQLRAYKDRLQVTLNNALKASPVRQEITRINPLTGQEIVRSKAVSLSIHSILQKIAITAREKFNSRYKSTLGIGAELEHLPGGDTYAW